MKAYVLHQVKELRYEDVEMPLCPDGWAVVQVKAAGICSSDIPRIFTKGTYHFPTIPGHEFAGIVYSVGNDKDKSWIGKHVGVFPLIPCRDCIPCKEKHYEMCANYDYIGSRRDGAFAEYVAVPIWNLVPLSESVPFTFAAMLEPLAVALHALRRGCIQEGNSVGIVGTGMIGIAAGLWAKKMNANVNIVGRSEDKRTLVESCGLNYITHTNKVFDFVLEAVGTPNAINSSINVTHAGGKLVLMGNPSGDICLSQDVYWRILRKQLHVYGTWNSSYDGANPSDWTETVKMLSSNGLDVQHLISHCYSQNNLLDGLMLMLNKKESYCKVMTIWNE